MPDEPGARAVTFRLHAVVEIALLAVLAGYFLLAGNQSVGDDLVFTVIGAALMAAASFWTLNTIKDGLELMASRARHS